MATPFDLVTGQGPGRALSQGPNPYVDSPQFTPGNPAPWSPNTGPQASGLLGALGNAPGSAGNTGGAPLGSQTLSGMQPAPSAPTGADASMPGVGAIQAAYQQYYGRPASPADIQQHLGQNPSWAHIQQTLSHIAASPEAKLRAMSMRAAKSTAGQPQVPQGLMLGNGTPNPAFMGGAPQMPPVPSPQAPGQIQGNPQDIIGGLMKGVALNQTLR